MNAVQDLLLVTCQGDPYSQEVSRRGKHKRSHFSVITAFQRSTLLFAFYDEF